MRRREFIALVGGAAAAFPRVVRAQQPTVSTIGFLGTDSAERFANRVHAFRQGLAAAGYFEGRNLQILFRSAEGHLDRLPSLAAELTTQKPDVIATGGSAGARALKAIKATVPVVFQAGLNPVEEGLVESLSRPGGNFTGATTLGVELIPKRLELIHELVPTASSVALLVNPKNKNESEAEEARRAARLLGLELRTVEAGNERDFPAAFSQVESERAGALIITPDSFLNGQSSELSALALRHRIPTIGNFRNFSAAGGLMSYGSSIEDVYRLMGNYTGRILGGEKPMDLPVVQSTKIELVINLKTAKSLGLTVPLPLLGRADEVIE